MRNQEKTREVLQIELDELQKAYNELYIKEERYRLLTEHARDVVWTQKLDGTITYLSPAVELLRGLTVEEAMNQSPDKILTPDSLAKSAGYMQKLASDFEAGLPLECFRGELDYYRKDGTILSTEVFAYPRFGRDLDSLLIIGVTRDITERKQFEAQLFDLANKLKELNAQKDKFFSIIAHDLKSPFNSILGFSELLMDQINEKDYKRIDEYAKIISQSSQRVMDLLMNLLEWSRAQTGRLEFNPENFDLVDLIVENKMLFDVVAGQKAISINKILPHEITVYADKPMISTVLRNLIFNAIKYTRIGGEINISAEKRATEILVSISDNGIGIAPRRLEKLFRIDENHSTSGTNNEKGTGLGLILCKEFVENHGGKIWVESEEGKGSVFYFTLFCNANLK